MWRNNPIVELLGIDMPVIQAGMAGGITTPELVAAVSNGGALGTLGAGYMEPDAIRLAIHRIRELTRRPFAVNLFTFKPSPTPDNEVQNADRALAPIRTELRIPERRAPVSTTTHYAEQLQVVLEERVPVFSCTFGFPDPALVQGLKRQGTVVIGTATNVREAVLLEQWGADAIVAQGAEAGGHRGTFAGGLEDGLVGTIALVPQVVDAVQVPVIASGGVSDGRALLAVLALGAQGIQLGSVFLPCIESGAHPAYKQAVIESNDQSTVLTHAFSGKYARGIRNRFTEQMRGAQNIAPYPVQNNLTRDIRNAAARLGDSQYMSLWAGQASRMARSGAAADILTVLQAELELAFVQLSTVLHD